MRLCSAELEIEWRSNKNSAAELLAILYMYSSEVKFRTKRPNLPSKSQAVTVTGQLLFILNGAELLGTQKHLLLSIVLIAV